MVYVCRTREWLDEVRKQISMETRTLTIVNCDIQDIRPLCDLLERFESSLVYLDLVECNIDDANAGILSTNLANFPKLECLDLGRNNIADEGAIAIIAVAVHHPRLRSLCFRHNRLGDRTAQFMNDLVQPCNLKTIDVGFNPLHGPGRTALAELIPKTDTYIGTSHHYHDAERANVIKWHTAFHDDPMKRKEL